MKKYSFFLILTVFLFTLTFIACNKEDTSEKEFDYKDALTEQEADIILKGDGQFEKVITKPLMKTDDCKFIVAGTIEFRKNDAVVAVIDFGDGTCDALATKTVEGETFEFSMKKKAGKYDKIILEPLIKTEDCQYIVSGIIQFVSGDKILATIDFGEGECDEWATKTWEGGSKVFSMAKGKN